VLTLINSNRMSPPIAPLGLDYVATAARAAGVPTSVIDLGLTNDDQALDRHFRTHDSVLVGISFRNIDDCFWPSCTSFVQSLRALVRKVRVVSEAPIVLGGVGLSLFASHLAALSGADFAIRGDGEQATIDLYRHLRRGDDWRALLGLCWKSEQGWVENHPAWPRVLSMPRSRDSIDNLEYFRRGGQGGIETKRGCPRRCIYCADPQAKGRRVRYREPYAVAEEAGRLLAQGIDVLHFCDGEFNIPKAHALAVCDALIDAGLSEKIRFYIYAAVRPFDAELASRLRHAGCAGINFTGDSAHPEVLKEYAAAHREPHLREAIRLCKAEGMVCMVDLLLGGPGETPETAAYTLRTLEHLEPDCVGAGLGMRLYPGTAAVEILKTRGNLATLPGIKRQYTGDVDLLWPTFYIAPELGPAPAKLIHEIVGNNPCFFLPIDETATSAKNDHNYNDNTALSEAISGGARGAYWDILRKLNTPSGV
jgi:tryptophan 2-C-methyltransferase